MCGVVAAAVLLALNTHLLATAGSHIAHFALNSTLAACLAVERAERVSERAAPSVTVRFSVITFKVLPSLYVFPQPYLSFY